MRRTSLLALAFLSIPFAAHADDASKRAKIEEMLAVSKVDGIAQQMVNNVPERVKTLASRQMMVQAADTPEQKKITDDYLAQMQTIARNGVTWTDLKPKIIDLYMAAFTEPDVDGILAFYKTPAGQAFIAKSGELSGKTIETLQAAVSTLQPQFESATRAYQTSMKGIMQQNPSSPGAAPAKAPTLGPETPSTGSAPKK